MSKTPQDLLKKTPFVVAPMDAVTDIAFRSLCEEYGSAYSTTELTSVDSLIRNKVPKARYIKDNLKTNSIQLFGKDPKVFVEAAKYVQDEADFIDVNFGCPSGTVTGNDCGAMLLKDPKNVSAILTALVNEIPKPITAKIRLGYQKKTFLEVAKEVEDAGVEVLAVHGRTAKQKYTGEANWDEIRQVYEQTNIFIVGNGDIREEEDIDKYLGSHANALMIGRAAIGNPFIFKRFNHYYKTKEKLELDNDEKKEMQKQLFSEYLERLSHHEFKHIFIKIQRQAMWFFKGIEGVKELRTYLQKAESIDEIKELIRKF